MQAYALTDIGQIRSTNQDYIFCSPTAVGPLPNLYIVADGMGGHKAGDYASRFLVENLVEYIESSTDTRTVSLMREGIQAVNHSLYEESKKEDRFEGMGSTIVAAVADGDTLYVANVGDSRLYLLHHHLKQVTRDHSYVEEMVALGMMNRGSKDYLGKKNIITRAIGTDEKVEIDFFEVPLKKGDQILLCSDGLTNMLDDKEIEKILKTDRNLRQKAEVLINEANLNGGRDNIAVVLAAPQISEVAQ